MIYTILLLRCVFLILSLSVQNSYSKPLFANCNRVPEGQIARFRDTEDCTIFYYCLRGQNPFKVQCPKLAPYDIQLYYHPEGLGCDSAHKAPSSCFSPGPPCIPPNCYTGTYPTTTSTTTQPTTTARAPKPPKLDDKPDFEIDCQGDKTCGLFPNTFGSCDKYIVCVNGQKVEKNCNAGFLFDRITKECKPSHLATCWTEPVPSPHITNINEKHCPFHDNPASTPIETETDGIILQNPKVTDWGEWQDWEYCPNGMYATGIYAWRRVLKEGWTGIDQIGIVSVSFICQTPGGNETKEIIESWAPNAPNDGWPFHYMCKGAVVGFRLNSVAENGEDEIGTDNVQAMCSCSEPAYKPYEQLQYYPQNGDRGDWTAPQFCKKGQAVCGMQTQMQEYKEYMIGEYDNNGLNNMKVKCCDVPNPLDTCVPKEERIHIRDCDNINGDESLICEFNAMVGLTYDYDTQAKASDFYSSIGYTFDDVKDKLSKKIVEKFEGHIRKLGSQKYEYTWDDIDEPAVMEDLTVSKKTVIVKKREKVVLMQYIGRCGHFIIRTNKYLRQTKKGNRNFYDYFEI